MFVNYFLFIFYLHQWQKMQIKQQQQSSLNCQKLLGKFSLFLLTLVLLKHNL